MKFAVVRITRPDNLVLEFCLRHNLSHNLINVARLTLVAGENRTEENPLRLRCCALYDNLWKVVTVNAVHA